MKYGVKYDVPSTFTTILFFYLNIFISGTLAWYFDHVDSSNRGKTYSYFFFLEKSYWCGRKKSNNSPRNVDNTYEKILMETIEERRILETNINDNKNISKIFHISLMKLGSDDMGRISVIEEKQKILESQFEGKEYKGLRILGSSKTYKISNNCCGTKEVKALKEVLYYLNEILRLISECQLENYSHS